MKKFHNLIHFQSASYLLVFLTWFFSFSSFALEYGCRLKPSQIEEVGFRWIKGHWQFLQIEGYRGKRSTAELADTLTVSTSYSSKGITDYEAFLRPKLDETFYFMNTFAINLEREKHLIYVCVHRDQSNPHLNHLTIYFLRAYGISPPLSGDFKIEKLANLPSNLLFGPNGLFNLFGALHNHGIQKAVSVNPLSIQIVPMLWLTDKPNSLANRIPFFGEFLKIPGTALKLVGNILDVVKEKLGAGAERVVLTNRYLDFATNVDLQNPSSSMSVYRADFKHGDHEE